MRTNLMISGESILSNLISIVELLFRIVPSFCLLLLEISRILMISLVGFPLIFAYGVFRSPAIMLQS